MSKESVSAKVKAMMIAENPLLGSEQYRRNMNKLDKSVLFSKMLRIAEKLSFFDGITL